MEHKYFDTIVIGTGAAGYNAACEIKKLCNKSVAIVTEDKLAGTSRNTGSDKQTYYKLTQGGGFADSVRKMAEDLYSGGAVDGDNALCEAALSGRCFYNLCSLGVPFPHNRYGEYVGYKTDHDPYMRATSAGPLTSRFMTEALENQAKRLGIPVLDRLLAVEIITDGNEVRGIVCFDKTSGELKALQCNNIVLATGGPAGIYYDSVYPDGHTGMSSLALNAGASLQNMTEWQFGLSSINPKWNVSGTYMQVLPRFVSIDENGNEEEFLSGCFSDEYEALSLVFLKGYQWPFDSRKAQNGSSQIDLAVYKERIGHGKRVFLDFTKNPFGLTEIDFERLSEEAYTYLKNADALFGTPAQRLKKMNSPAIDLYKSKGVDIEKDYLEISLCAQHNNGGISVDKWWQTSVTGLFAAGECAGTHGITRPGGSALNAGQAGSLRAAQFISEKEEAEPSLDSFALTAEEALARHRAFLKKIKADENTGAELLAGIRVQMSECAAAVRFPKEIAELFERRKRDIDNFPFLLSARDNDGIVDAYKYRDTLITQAAVLLSMKDYYEKTSLDRGSAIHISDCNSADSVDLRDKIQTVSCKNGEFFIKWRSTRPIPDEDAFFENVWRAYRENKNIY